MATLKLGSRGKEVKELQRALFLLEDGVFGKNTLEAVLTFQRENHLKEDGIVGEKTWEVIKAKQQADSSSLKRSQRRIDEIIIHCSATPEGKDYTVDKIREWHTKPVSKGGRGWSDIGYHYIIYRDGSVHEGRNVNIAGAHCTNHNAHSIGICYVGGCEATNVKKSKDTRTKEQRKALLELLRELRSLYPKAKIYGHRNFAAKDCPSFDAKTEYKNI